MTSIGSLSGIYIYPVKSLPGILLDRACITKNGMAHPDNHQVVDRKWMLVDKTNSFLSQRKMPKMALIHQKLMGDHLVLSTPDKRQIKVPISMPENKIKCRLWSTTVDCFAYGGEIAEWLTDFLNEYVDLVSLGNNLEQRNSKEADFNSFMLISQASLNELNSRLDVPVTMRNFRPNLIVKDCSAFDEDNWINFKIGECSFLKTGFCIRCLFTTIDPDCGVRSQKQQPLKTLKNYRMREEIDRTGPLFGIYLNCSNESSHRFVSIGDSIVSLD